MSEKEIYANGARDERRAGFRFAIILGISIVLLFVLTVGALYALFSGKLRRGARAKEKAHAGSSAQTAGQ